MQLRSRDLIVYAKGDTIPVTIHPDLLKTGWIGGQGVAWVSGYLDQLTVGTSNCHYGGFLLWGSDESADQYNSMTQNQLVYGKGVLGYGGWLISTIAYERYTYLSRTVPGPLVPIVYQPNDVLYFSYRGYWTNEDELALSGSPKPSNPCGRVSVIPKPSTAFWLGVQTAL